MWRHRGNPNSQTHSPESGKSEIKETSLFTKAGPPVLIAVDPVLVRSSKDDDDGMNENGTVIPSVRPSVHSATEGKTTRAEARTMPMLI